MYLHSANSYQSTRPEINRSIEIFSFPEGDVGRIVLNALNLNESPTSQNAIGAKSNWAIFWRRHFPVLWTPFFSWIFCVLKYERCRKKTWKYAFILFHLSTYLWQNMSDKVGLKFLEILWIMLNPLITNTENFKYVCPIELCECLQVWIMIQSFLKIFELTCSYGIRCTNFWITLYFIKCLFWYMKSH